MIDRIFSVVVLTFFVACPAGTKTAVEASVSVKVDASCSEDRTSPQARDVAPDLALLDCATVEGGGTVRVLFPRKTWLTIRHEGLGAIDAGPGK